MKENIYRLRLESNFTLALIIYSILGILLLNYYQYQIDSDGVSYISLAQKYVKGDIYNAINAYWGPLLSWLLTPFLLFGLKPLLAVKLLNLIIGFLAILGLRSLSYKFEMAERIRSAIFFSLIPIVLSFSTFLITPDLLLATILVFYLDVIFDSCYVDRVYNGILCGALGGIAYLCKIYAFHSFILLFFIFNMFHFFRNKRKKVFLNFFLGLIVFLIISGSWSLILSNKYKEITIGSSPEFNKVIVGPGPKSGVHPMYYQGFFKPPNETAISVWEDPTYLIKTMKPWSPFESWNSFNHQLTIIKDVLYRTVLIYSDFSTLSIAIIIAYILFCVSAYRIQLLSNDLLFPLITVIIFPLGYTLVLVEARYLWIVDFLLLLMGGYTLNVLFKNAYFTETMKKVTLAFFILSFIAIPTKNLIRNINIGKKIHDIYKELDGRYNIDGNVAANRDWRNSFHLSYYLDVSYYGIPRENISSKELMKELEKNNIDYYIVWDYSRWDTELLSNYKEITRDEISGLRIYSLKEKL